MAAALNMAPGWGDGRRDAERRTTDQESDLLYNKTRQTAIPKELMDIVGGAEALR